MEPIDKTYTIELNEKQLRLLNEAVEFTSRWIMGDCGTISWPQAATHHQEMNTKEDFDGWIKRRDQLDALMDVVKMIGWNLRHPGSSKGIGYNQDADALYEMHCSIRHELWNAAQEDIKEATRHTVSARPPLLNNSGLPFIRVTPHEQ
jgi:hypothetical protein